jgi:hypothetical protein
LSTSRRANFLLLFIHSTFTHSTTPRFLVFTQSSSSLSPLLSSAILLLPPLALFVSSFTSPVSSWRLDLLLLPLLHILRPRLLGTTFSSSAALMLVFPGGSIVSRSTEMKVSISTSASQMEMLTTIVSHSHRHCPCAPDLA